MASKQRVSQAAMPSSHGDNSVVNVSNFDKLREQSLAMLLYLRVTSDPQIT